MLLTWNFLNRSADARGWYEAAVKDGGTNRHIHDAVHADSGADIGTHYRSAHQGGSSRCNISAAHPVDIADIPYTCMCTPTLSHSFPDMVTPTTLTSIAGCVLCMRAHM